MRNRAAPSQASGLELPDAVEQGITQGEESLDSAPPRWPRRTAIHKHGCRVPSGRVTKNSEASAGITKVSVTEPVLPTSPYSRSSDPKSVSGRPKLTVTGAPGGNPVASTFTRSPTRAGDGSIRVIFRVPVDPRGSFTAEHGSADGESVGAGPTAVGPVVAAD